ncbi:MAG: zinc ribbon domain-containing protein [Ruminococcus sp.]|nr:zinc ribbon domain-containing protein [Ruminococcus sp.]
MFCKNCGSSISKGTFCPKCGTDNTPVAGGNGYANISGVNTGKKINKMLPLILAGVAVLVVVIILICIIGNSVAKSGPKKAVELYYEAMDEADVDDIVDNFELYENNDMIDYDAFDVDNIKAFKKLTCKIKMKSDSDSMNETGKEYAYKYDGDWYSSDAALSVIYASYLYS